jgi:hypothetical protein
MALSTRSATVVSRESPLIVKTTSYPALKTFTLARASISGISFAQRSWRDEWNRPLL